MEAKPEAVYELSFQHEKEKVQLQFRIDKGLSNLERIQKQIFKHKKTGVIFGIPVEQVLRQEKRHIDDGGSGIPMVVEYIVEYLRTNGSVPSFPPSPMSFLFFNLRLTSLVAALVCSVGS